MTIMTEMPPSATPALDYDSTLIMTVEISDEKWMVAAQVPGLARVTSKRTVMPEAEELMAAVEGYQRRAATAGCDVKRVIVAYEAGRSAFWLARWLSRRGVEVHVIQPSSVPVDRRLRRAKSDGIDVELLLRTLLAWLRGEPRVCSMVPIPDPVDEDARRFVRERQELLGERIALSNRIDAVLATLGIRGYDPRRRDRRVRLAQLQTALGGPIPPHAHAKIARMLDRLELVLAQLVELERQRDAVMEDDAPGRAERMIQHLARLRGIGLQSATLLVREAFVREFTKGKALGAYAGLVATPYSSGGSEREQGISKAGNRRLRTAAVELAWLWLRYQPDSALVRWFHGRLGTGQRRVRKVLIVALARRLLIALWRYAIQGVLPEDASLKAAV
jgi:transposase